MSKRGSSVPHKAKRSPARFLALLVAAGFVYLLNTPLGGFPALGRLLDPVNGSLANAEPVNKDFSGKLKIKGVSQETSVWIDDRMVPHVHAANEHDMFFMEGYLHAYFRLWQMDMETRAAAGRISEVMGKAALNFDRKQRRKGMVYGAENSLGAMEKDPMSNMMIKAYTEGVNAYIATLNYRDYPLEYKLIGFAPEDWTSLKVALLLKYMADDLTGKTDDIALTYLRDKLPKEELDLLFPERLPGAPPAIPAGTIFDKPSLTTPQAPPDSVAFPRFKPADFGEVRDDGKGSNNWALSGSRTASGAPILCNDPHLGLNLPSIWFEMQLQAPGINVYGASLPGTPGVIIGFNDSLTWGFTNNYRDVKDFYLIKPVTGDNDKYWFEGKQIDFKKRVETIKIKGQPDFVDTVRYTVHGPVMYDDHYSDKDGMKEMLAVCWMGHRGTNEMKAIYLMNKARNYGEFVNGIMNFQCPAQNMAYADRAGNIALWGQGQFVNKWRDQGKYVMNGGLMSTLWQQLIPMQENPHVLNPAQGYVTSANQVTTDSTYPYWYNGSGFVYLRAMRLNNVLSKIEKATVEDMFKLQNDVYSELAAQALPQMLRTVNAAGPFNQHEIFWLASLKNWDFNLNATSNDATFFQVWWNFFARDVWGPVLGNVPNNLTPLQERTMQLMKDTIAVANVQSPEQRISLLIDKAIVKSFRQAVDSVAKYPPVGSTQRADSSSKDEWFWVKNTTVAHLTKLPAFSYNHLRIGGWGNTVNAAKSDHGPSWRMVVQMGKDAIEAYGVYPGGQSGNPGSKNYADFLQHWVEGKYYRLLFLPNAEKQNDARIKYVWTIAGQ